MILTKLFSHYIQGTPLFKRGRGVAVGVAILSLAALAAVFIFVLIWIPRSIDNSPGHREFIIARGQSLQATARELAGRDWIINRFLFVAYATLTGHEKDFKAGRYILPERASARDLVNIFSQGQSEPDDVAVIIPEGSNAADIDKILTEARLIRRGEFLETALVFEGELFPDTYRFQKPEIIDQKSEEDPDIQAQNRKKITESIILKMRENFMKKTTDLFRNLDTQKIKETVLIASMLEKEVQSEEDMMLVAGIIKKRLEFGMPLQIDATVAYGVCYNNFLSGQYCDVSQANIVDNLKIDSGYNTYIKHGLPAGPISNPGLKAINAALNPRGSDFLFYLSARNGATIFSKTAVEQEYNRAKYLQITPKNN